LQLCTVAMYIACAGAAQLATSGHILPLLGASHSMRHLVQTVTPDCGLAYQPCCPGAESCMEDSLSCIARDPSARCEPCGTPFAQPCPQYPFCEATELIPTTSEAPCLCVCLNNPASLPKPSIKSLPRVDACLALAGRSDSIIQCRPCGQEWQPCCAVLDSLCGDGFICYAEQDRCVVPIYANVKEEFFPGRAFPSHVCVLSKFMCAAYLACVHPSSVRPAVISSAMAATPVCGGVNDPPCMEPSPEGPTWQCDEGLITFIPGVGHTSDLLKYCRGMCSANICER
jgi:hypothetical protein